MTADTDRLLARIARLEAQTDIRGRAVAIYQQRAREAKERIQAVEDALDGYTKFIHVEHIRAALHTELLRLESGVIALLEPNDQDYFRRRQDEHLRSRDHSPFG